MTWWNSRALRIQDEIELKRWGESDGSKKGIKNEQKDAKKDLLQSSESNFETKSRTRVFPEDYGRVETSILDPRGPVAGKWNMIFFAAGLVSLFVDPLFFFLPNAEPDYCFDIIISLRLILTIVRTAYDVLYVVHIGFQFRTAYIAPSSRVFGRGELVIDPWKIAYRYLVKGFWADVMAAIPLPQILVWAIIPNLSDSVTSHPRIVLWFTIILQYFLRLALIYPLSSQIVNSSGVMTTEKAWVGAAYNMTLYIMASHFSGAIYYMLAVERQELCWRSVCAQEAGCEYSYFNCGMVADPGRSAWFQTTNVTSLCDASATNSYYLWGIYQIAVQNGQTSSSFLHKYFYSLWTGIQALCSIGQTYTPSIFVGENIYCIANSSLGLILIALLIGNMQVSLLYRVAKSHVEEP